MARLTIYDQSLKKYSLHHDKPAQWRVLVFKQKRCDINYEKIIDVLFFIIAFHQRIRR
jgi:hypothetical protein